MVTWGFILVKTYGIEYLKPEFYCIKSYLKRKWAKNHLSYVTKLQMETRTQVCPIPIASLHNSAIAEWGAPSNPQPCRIPCQNLNETMTIVTPGRMSKAPNSQTTRASRGSQTNVQLGAQETWVQASAQLFTCYGTCEYTTPWLSFPFCKAKKRGPVVSSMGKQILGVTGPQAPVLTQ